MSDPDYLTRIRAADQALRERQDGATGRLIALATDPDIGLLAQAEARAAAERERDEHRYAFEQGCAARLELVRQLEQRESEQDRLRAENDGLRQRVEKLELAVFRVCAATDGILPEYKYLHGLVADALALIEKDRAAALAAERGEKG